MTAVYPNQSSTLELAICGRKAADERHGFLPLSSGWAPLAALLQSRFREGSEGAL
jgi:hypothetical protein